MSGSIGKTNKLSGDLVPFRGDGTPCDHDGCYDDASFEVVSEVDSFGAETSHLCRVHYLEFKATLQAEVAESHHCDICNSEKVGCRDMRDPDEGMTGPVYSVCPDCRSVWAQRASDDLDDDQDDPSINIDDDPFPDPDSDLEIYDMNDQMQG